ncbi:hypothetical protein MFLAVUS_006065 [Mucor flavus]|uniref:Uncharacterized protein n=1 Tax=Mucor flavus TaxID=439312 RepID=A0ABP9Z0H8_9FUNG
MCGENINANYITNSNASKAVYTRHSSFEFRSLLSSSEEEDTEDLTSIADRDVSDSTDSEAEPEVPTPYVHRRQTEEIILDKPLTA